ncbi:hypothetical protein ABOM_002346 [Aspergillus bombycis]|uniref:Tat pathway signal sequence n=1 Tax=Aspergillus bombycis TaxID=109264 RepID=A0A1F8AC83_9EURO|nr:hypothetical protein ABOM_002346 [Aspergillus bombycis]OGM49045.1 hypothetical protein ABOM_002346 [Aspergillus bombycis]
MDSSYVPVRLTESHDEEICEEEEKRPLRSRFQFPLDSRSRKRTPRFWLNLWSLFNTIFSVALLIVAIFLINQTKGLTDKPVPVYCEYFKSLAQSSADIYDKAPVREDGAERYINTRYRPNRLFQSSPSDEVDEAWNGWLREHDHLFKFPQEKAREVGLPETVELYNDPGYGAYGLGVYHQMHCLNRIRKSFYPDRYYPNQTQHQLLHHINHCFDVLRQAILCHGDISVVYWWNKNYTYIDPAGNRQYSEDYLRRTPEERDTGSFVTWDSQLQCRDMDAINAWAKVNQVDDDKYGGQVVD